MTVDQTTGYVYFVFYDRRNYSDNNTDVYMARSTDGCSTFTNFVVSQSPFLPGSSTFFGDYNNVTAANGHVRPIWTRLVGGTLSVWTALVEFPTAVENNNNKIPSAYALEQNYPNPFNPSTTIKFTVPANVKHESSNVKISIYDILGREVTKLLDENLTPGTYDITWNAANSASGIYFYRMTLADK